MTPNTKQERVRHAKRRASERYTDLTRSDIIKICQLIMANKSEPICRKSNRFTIHRVVYNEDTYVVLYDKNEKIITTFLPKDCSEVRAHDRKRESTIGTSHA